MSDTFGEISLRSSLSPHLYMEDLLTFMAYAASITELFVQQRVKQLQD